MLIDGGTTSNDGNGLSLDDLTKACVPKAFGGLGFGGIHEFNLALLCTQGWKLMKDPNFLLAQLLKDRCS